MSQDSNASDEMNQLEGEKWDDGSDHDDVTKIYVIGGGRWIQFIKIDYVKSGQPKNGSFHGFSDGGFMQMFEINHLKNEYLESVEGYYGTNGGFIEALQFKNNLRVSDMMGYTVGNRFKLASHGKKVIGFQGSGVSSSNTLMLAKWKPVCTGERKAWTFQKKEFVLDYPNEYLTSVEGTYIDKPGYTLITSLTFKTSKGRTSLRMANASNGKFFLESKGCALVGFHGLSTNYCLYALGAYSFPMTPLPEVEKLDAQAGDGGVPQDDCGLHGV